MTDIDVVSSHRRLRAAAPLTQCITNTVVQQFTANLLLAAGASPAMLDHEADAAAFTRLASGLLVNFGTASSAHLLAADSSIAAAGETGTPWVLDPVSYGAVPFRTTRISRALGCSPTAIRGNASEIAALAGAGSGAKGTDAVDEVDAVLPAAARLAAESGSVVAVSGPVDAVVWTADDGETRIARITGGHALMPLVIGTGCALGALTAACLGSIEQPQAAAEAGSGDAPHSPSGPRGDIAAEAVVTAHALLASAGARAGAVASGPGSFAPALLDALHATTDDDLVAVDIAITTAEGDAR